VCVVEGVSKEVQAELDEGMTLRHLDVSIQGTYDSYLESSGGAKT
jgi:hypothetical protein